MARWKGAAAAAVGGAAVITMVALGVDIRGQERRSSEAPRARTFGLAGWFGGQIGVTVHDSDSGSGVVVEEVRDNSPAAKAGVKEKDVIVEFDGERVRSSRQFSRLVDETPQGRAVKLTVQRAGQRVALDVTPEARQWGRVTPVPFDRFTMPELPDMPDFTPRIRDFERRLLPEVEMYSGRAGRLGVQLEDVEDQLAEYFGVKNGALITSVAKDTPAARAGLKAGDVITKVNGEAIEDTGGVRRELRRIDADQEFAVDVVRDRKPVSVKVKLDPPSGRSKRPGTPTEPF
jgi:serine protease Do